VATAQVPDEFRVIGTASTATWGAPANLDSLKGHFSFIEVGIPEKALEYEKIPYLVRQRMLKNSSLSMEDIVHQTFTTPDKKLSRFHNDEGARIQKAYDMLMKFTEKEIYPPKGTIIPRGIRTYKAIGTDILVDTILVVVNSQPGSDKRKTLEKAMISNIMPLLEDINAKDLANVQLKAKEVFGPGSKIVEMLNAFISNQAGGSDLLIEYEEKEKTVDSWADEEEQEILGIRAEEVNDIRVNFDIELAPIFDHLSISQNTVDQILTNLKSGRNIILYGAPGCGKTKVATLLCKQLCGRMPAGEGREVDNFTIVTANAEWDNYDIVGGVAPKVDKYTHEITYEFKDGYVATAVKDCLHGLKRINKPHYLIIDEFNRANIDEAFGKLFTIFEYKDVQPLLNSEENKGQALNIPNQFRLIGTMNVQDKNTLFNIGHALMRRFAFIEIGLPDPKDEFKRIPHFVELRCSELGIHIPGKKTPKSMFRGDVDGKGEVEYRKLMKFLKQEEVPDEGKEVATGVRTYRQIGVAQVLDCVIWTLNVKESYPKEQAMQDAVIANVLPQLENLEQGHVSNIYKKAVEVFGERSRISQALDRMRKSSTLSVFG
jgi:MoxR-like ATPase